MFWSFNRKGFTLVEILVGVAVFVLFALGIYGGAQLVFKVVFLSRLRIVETALLNQEIEIIRNMPFADVGITEGSPAGVLSRTVTTSVDNIEFLITRTIRNVDDEFDGLAGGTPNDTAPADYKLVEVEVICTNCNQQEPARMITFVAPKLLEGDPTHGALYIEVFDANANPVSGATVHVVATSTDPTLDLTDLTDNNGMLRLVDLGAGMNAYNITVSKAGYTSDYTISPSEAMPNPLKEPVSVEAQGVTEISFVIDEIASLDLSTKNFFCNTISGVPINIVGTKVWGTEPDVLKVDDDIYTNGLGNYLFNNLEWDNYGLRPTGYDLLGSIPSLPINILPGVNQEAVLILGANTANSLLVNVRDSITGQSLSNASVRVYDGGYDETKTTGVGFIRQTDWSGGLGQLEMGIDNKYWADDGKIENNSPSGDLKLIQVGESYVSDGTLESSIFDLGLAVDFVNLNWQPVGQPEAVGDNSVRWQIATDNTSTTESWNYFGPDGTESTFYNEENFSIAQIHNGDRYLRYKLFLKTASSTYSPTVSDVTVGYTTSCTPPGQAYFGGLDSRLYNVVVTRDGYQNYLGTITVSGDLIFDIGMVAE